MKTKPISPANSSVHDDLALLMNSIKEYAIIRLDANGHIISWNEGAKQIKGYTQDEIIGKDFALFYSTEDIAAGVPRANLQLAKTQGSYTGTGWRLRKDGSAFWADIVITALYAADGSLRGFVKITRDITRQKALSDELEYLHLEQQQDITEALNLTLKENTDYKHALDESAIVAITNQKGVITHVNDNFCKISKYGREELLGRDHRIINSGYHDRAFIRTLWTTIARGEIWKGELKNRAKDGSIYWVDTTIVPFLDRERKPYQYLAIRFDITQRKQEETHLRLLESVITNTTDAVLVTEAEPLSEPGPRIVYVNEAFTRMTGYSAADMIGKTPRMLQGPKSDPAELKKLSTALRHFQPAEVTIVNYHKNGGEFWMNLAVSPVTDEKGRHTHFIAIQRDVTQRKKEEERLKELNESFERHAKELALSNAELEQFAYVASHDLQEPLRMVTSFLSLLENKYGDSIDEKGKQYIFFAVDGAKRMRQIILDLLEFSRVGKTDEKLEEVDLNELINDILPLYRKQIEERKAVITVDALPTLLTYKVPVRQVFQNLISNALKYVKPDVCPAISIVYKEEAAYHEFRVQDNGIGIDPEFFDKIFIIFQRLHNKDEYSGTGMGLATTKKIIENLGGKIGLHSAEGKGSSFYFTLLKNNH